MLGKYDSNQQDFNLSYPVNKIIENILAQIILGDNYKTSIYYKNQRTSQVLGENLKTQLSRNKSNAKKVSAETQVEEINLFQSPEMYKLRNQLNPEDPTSYMQIYQNLVSNLSHTNDKVDHSKRFQILKSYLNQEQNQQNQLLSQTLAKQTIMQKRLYQQNRYKNQVPQNNYKQIFQDQQHQDLTLNSSRKLHPQTIPASKIVSRHKHSYSLNDSNHLLQNQQSKVIPGKSGHAIMKLIHNNQSPQILKESESKDRLLMEANIKSRQILIENIIKDRDRKQIKDDDPLRTKSKIFYNHFNI